MSGHDVSVAAEKRARLMSAFMAAPTKRFSPSRPAWRASVGRAAPHSSHPCHALNLPYGSYGAMEQFIQSPSSSGTLVHLCRSGRLLVLWSTTGNLQGQSQAALGKVPCRHVRCREARALGVRAHGNTSRLQLETARSNKDCNNNKAEE